MSRTLVTLGADVGGKDAHEATHAHILAFRKLLDSECKGPYSNKIKEIALVLRIDGSVQAWGKNGVEGVAIQKGGTFATADIFVSRDKWASHDVATFRNCLVSGVTAAMTAIAEYARQQGVDLLRENLERDVCRAALKFTEFS